jgi:hypothetical protein
VEGTGHVPATAKEAETALGVSHEHAADDDGGGVDAGEGVGGLRRRIQEKVALGGSGTNVLALTDRKYRRIGSYSAGQLKYSAGLGHVRSAMRTISTTILP